MKSRTKGIAVVAITIGLVLFLFYAPVFYWFTISDGGPVGEGVQIQSTVYRSAGCIFFGIGDTYGTGYVGFSWGCYSPPIPF